MTVEEMKVQYPNQWLGIKEPRYRNNDGVTLESGEVVYIGETKEQLLRRVICNGEKIVKYFTGKCNWSSPYTVTIIEENSTDE